MFSKSTESGRGNVGEHEVSNHDVLEAGLDDDRKSVEGEGVHGLSLAVAGVDPEETLESTVDLPLNEATPIIKAMSALEVRSQFGPTEEDLITVLSPELALNLFMFMGPEDLLELAQTCHILRFLSEDDKLWKRKCEEAILPYCLDSAEEDLLRHRNTMNSSLQEILRRLDRMEVSFEFSPWKANFLKHIRQLCKPCGIQMNFRKNPLRRPLVLKLDDHHVYTCMEFVGNKIVSASAKTRFETGTNTLKIWDPLSGICLFNLEGRGMVTTIQVHNHIFLSGSTDGSLKMWNANTGECVRTLQGPTGPWNVILSAHLYDNLLVTGAFGGTVRLWNVFGVGLILFMGHHIGVLCVQYNGRLVASGSHGSTVKIWNPETNECLHTCDGHTGPILGVVFVGDQVVSISTDKNIRVWNVEDGTCTHTFEECEGGMGVLDGEYGMELRGYILVSIHTHSIVKIWDTRTWECLLVLDDINKHSEVVSAFDFNEKFLVTGSKDGKVKLWDITTGDFIRDLLVLKQGGQGTQVRGITMKDAMISCSIVRRSGSNEIHVFNFDHFV